MFHMRWLAAVSMLGVTIAGWAWQRLAQQPRPTTRPGEPTMTFGTLVCDGRDRTYAYWRPTDASAQHPTALVLVLHGALGGSDTIGRWSGFRELAEAQHFAVCFPNGVGRVWSDGRSADDDRTTDDVRFLDALLDALLQDGAIDPARVYLIGMSSGGMMAQRYALERSERVAAIGVVAGSLPNGLRTHAPPRDPVPLIVFHGRSDTVVPFEGGQAAQQYGEVLAARDSVQLWARWNECRTRVGAREIIPVNTKTGLGVSQESYTDGRGGAEVEFYVIAGAGHTWPGVSRTRNEWLGWKSTLDIRATDRAWDFFRKHPKNKSETQPAPGGK